MFFVLHLPPSYDPVSPTLGTGMGLFKAGSINDELVRADPHIALHRLIHLPPEQLADVDLALMSLLCATGLPGAEDVDIPKYLARVNEWADLVRREMPKYKGGFRRNPADFDNHKSVYDASILVTILKRDLGIRYNPERLRLSSEEVRGNRIS
jgi:hypothetical protein